jgi:hypothetical protein
MTEEAEREFSILFPVIDVNFRNNDMTFIINHMKSRVPSAVYFIMHYYKTGENKDTANHLRYTSPRWVVDNTYSQYTHSFTIDDSILRTLSTYQIELRLVNITSENPLYFTEVMLTDQEFDDYHVPNEVIEDKIIKFNKSRYTNLYDGEENYLQVIRPNGDDITTGQLTRSKCTVLAPHLDGESDIDNPVNIFLEFLNQKEQRIDVLR